MTTRINIIKTNKFILRDYIAVITECIFHIEEYNNNNNNHVELNVIKIQKLQKYKIILKEYIYLNFEQEMNDNDLKFIVDNVILFVPENRRDFPSIFNENIYNDLSKNLKEISYLLLNKRIINEGIQEYIFDYVNNNNRFEIWKILFGKSVYTLYNYEVSLNNGYAGPIFTNFEDFHDSITLEEIPIEDWPFNGNNDNYVEYIELLYSYYDSEYTKHNINPVDEVNDDDEDDDSDDLEEVFIKKIINTFKILNDYLYNNNCLSTALYNKMNEYINNCNIHDKYKLECAKLRYNAYCYILIQII